MAAVASVAVEVCVMPQDFQQNIEFFRFKQFVLNSNYMYIFSYVLCLLYADSLSLCLPWSTWPENFPHSANVCSSQFYCCFARFSSVLLYNNGRPTTERKNKMLEYSSSHCTSRIRRRVIISNIAEHQQQKSDEVCVFGIILSNCYECLFEGLFAGVLMLFRYV